MTYPTDADANRRFSEEHLRQLSLYPDGAADAIRSAATNGASSAEVPQNHEQTNPQTSTTADGWNF